MQPILPKSVAADLIVAARLRKGITWVSIAESIGAPLVWTTAALLGQHPMTQEQAAAVCALLDLDDTVAESLRSPPPPRRRPCRHHPGRQVPRLSLVSEGLRATCPRPACCRGRAARTRAPRVLG